MSHAAVRFIIQCRAKWCRQQWKESGHAGFKPGGYRSLLEARKEFAANLNALEFHEWEYRIVERTQDVIHKAHEEL